MEYHSFLEAKTHVGSDSGFEPEFMPDMLFDFQKFITEWAIKKGRAAIYADCGLGKTFMQLVWAENVCGKTGGRVLILTPLAVAFQTVREGSKIGVDVTHRREGINGGDRIVVSNYERLHYFNAEDFSGVVCDESSILKNFDGATRKEVTDFMRKRPYRLLCTATAAPNDYIELGTSSEALGELGSQDMLNRFFKREKDYVKLYNSGGQGWEMRPYAEKDFWRWVVSWARAIRRPSDVGFDDNGFKLPELIVRSHTVKASAPRAGFLFDLPAVGLDEQRADLRHTLNERVDMAAQLINSHDNPAVAWCNLNSEGDLLTRSIRGAVQVSGSDTEDYKEKVFQDFISGSIRVLVTKPTIGGFGLNLQHCAHETFFPSHSYEQYYQAVRRCWRFGQKREVNVDVIYSEGFENVVNNLERKQGQADKMFESLVKEMNNSLSIDKNKIYNLKENIPSWLKN